MRSQSDDGGQVTALLAAAIGLIALMLLGLAPAGRALTDRARARTAADAAALAGAAEGGDAAGEIARLNGAEVVSYRAQGDEVVVKVTVDGVVAYGRARRIPVPAAADQAAGLAPSMLVAIAEAERLLGRPVPIVSGFRSPSQQQALWDSRFSNPFPVARPGTSLHERGLAIDVPAGFVDDLLAVASAAGLCQPLPESDPIHFIVCQS